MDLMKAFLNLCWRTRDANPRTTRAAQLAFAHLKRGGSPAGAAGLVSRDPVAQALFLQAVREAGW